MISTSAGNSTSASLRMVARVTPAASIMARIATRNAAWSRMLFHTKISVLANSSRANFARMSSRAIAEPPDRFCKA